VIPALSPTITLPDQFSIVPPPQVVPSPFIRPSAAGKFLFCGGEKFTVRGVTYGTFRTDESGNEILNRDLVERDFKAMVQHGFNAVRMYTMPPRWLLDLASLTGFV
jgi:hypothetical protein